MMEIFSLNGVHTGEYLHNTSPCQSQSRGYSAESTLTSGKTGCIGNTFRAVLMIPSTIWAMAKRVLCLLTLGFCCNSRINLVAELKVIESLRDTWSDSRVSAEVKQAAFEQACKQNPQLKERIIDAVALQEATAGVKPHKREVEIVRWEKEKGEAFRERISKGLDAHDTVDLNRYIGILNAKINQ